MMKGSVQGNHIPVNNFEMIIIGLPPILFTNISGFEDETEAIDMPDRTKVSGGNSKPVEFTGTTFEHHTIELAAMEFWRREGLDPVNPTYKKVATLIKRSIDGSVASTRTCIGLWIMKRKDADLDMSNEGEPAMIEWSFSADSVESI